MSDSGAYAPRLEGSALVKKYRLRAGLGRSHTFTAVDSVSVSVESGETLAVVGESGSGKTTLGRMLVGLASPDGGEVCYRGRALHSLRGQQKRAFRRSVQMVFQNPLASFSPMLTVGQTFADSLRLRGRLNRRERDQLTTELLAQVNLDPSMARRRPGDMSGGQLQRVGIARALAPRPEIVVLDEPTSALDASLHGEIVNLLVDLQRDWGIAYVLISHDLRIARAMADRAVVMYLGAVMEQGPAESVLNDPAHPYTRALLAAAPTVRGEHKFVSGALRGEVTRLSSEYNGCPLVGRCPYALENCHDVQELRSVGPRHEARCWRAEELGFVTPPAKSVIPQEEG